VNNGVVPNENKKDLKCFLRTKIGFRRQTGYHPELVCLLLSAQPRIPVVNCVLIYSKNNMLLFGTDESFVCVDYANRTILMNVSCCEFYGKINPTVLLKRISRLIHLEFFFCCWNKKGLKIRSREAKSLRKNLTKQTSQLTSKIPIQMIINLWV
jgi:hypothetical protein